MKEELRREQVMRGEKGKGIRGALEVASFISLFEQASSLVRRCRSCSGTALVGIQFLDVQHFTAEG